MLPSTDIWQRQRKVRLEVSFQIQSLGLQILFCYQKFNLKQIFFAPRFSSEVFFLDWYYVKINFISISYVFQCVCFVAVTFRPSCHLSETSWKHLLPTSMSVTYITCTISVGNPDRKGYSCCSLQHQIHVITENLHYCYMFSHTCYWC
jgi:hypothetical protein